MSVDKIDWTSIFDKPINAQLLVNVDSTILNNELI